MTSTDVGAPTNSTLAGLSRYEVDQRVAAGQTNQTARLTTRTTAGILRRNTFTFFNAVLTVAIVALLAIRAYNDVFFLAAVTAANLLAGIISELRAKRALERLTLLAQREVTVIRDAREQTIPVEQVVKDDVIAVHPGDSIIADGHLVSPSPIGIDESLLTGESDVVTKKLKDPLLSGSFCVSGTGLYVATGIGAKSHANVLMAQAKTYQFTRSPLERIVARLVQTLTITMGVLVVLLIFAGYIKHLSLAAGILSIVTAVKALVPEGLVLITTLAFSLAAARAATRQVLVQKLNAVEALSHVTTLCFDKTGTLGTNRLVYERLELFAMPLAEVTERLQLLVGATHEKNRTVDAIASAFPGKKNLPIEEQAFSSQTKTSAVRVRIGVVEASLWLGAPEALGTVALNPVQQKMLEGLRRDGLRVVLLAATESPIPRKEGMVNLAFIVLRDELRTDVGSAISFYQTRDVRLKVLSGDNAETVAAVARQAGVAITGGLVNGPELEALPAAEFAAAVSGAQVFGRLTPQSKEHIVQSLQAAGEFVGMVGDGVNDILALKRADIGIAMNSGAAAARDVADIILLRDSFANLPALSLEGDRIIYNVTRISKLFLAKNIYSLFFIVFVGFIGLEFPLSPRSITWIDLLSVGTPAFLLTFMTAEVGKQSVANFLGDTLAFATVSGLTIGLISLVVYANFFLFQDRTETYGHTAALSSIILMGLFAVYRVAQPERTQPKGSLQRLGVWALLGGAGLLQVVAIYWPPSRDFLGLTSLDADSWITIVAASGAGMVLMHLLSQPDRRRRWLGV
jgi:cation-transporting ATPase E